MFAYSVKFDRWSVQFVFRPESIQGDITGCPPARLFRSLFRGSLASDLFHHLRVRSRPFSPSAWLAKFHTRMKASDF